MGVLDRSVPILLLRTWPEPPVVAMPELPEVEHARLLLSRHVLGKPIKAVTALDDTKPGDGKRDKGVDKALKEALVGKQGRQVHRKGKYLTLELDQSSWVVAHFGMTGSFVVKGVKPGTYKSFDVDEAWPPRFWKVVLTLQGGKEDAFVDARRFARFTYWGKDPNVEKPLCDLGPDAYLEPPSLRGLHDQLSARRRPIKAMLLDQSFLSGIGNWVGDEILYQARIHPEQSSDSFSLDLAESLLGAMKDVLGTAVAAEADSSKFPSSWIFHSRWTGKKASKVEGKAVKFITVGSRTTAFCPTLQKKKAMPVKKEEEKKAKKTKGSETAIKRETKRRRRKASS